MLRTDFGYIENFLLVNLAG